MEPQKKTQNELEKRETLMELEHMLADLRSQRLELAAKQDKLEIQEKSAQTEWQRVRKEVSNDVKKSYETTQGTKSKPGSTQSAASQQDARKRDASVKEVLGANAGRAKAGFDKAADPAKVQSEQVKNSKPEPVLKPSPQLSHGVDAAAHTRAKSEDHQTSLQANRQAQAEEKLFAGLGENAGAGHGMNQTAEQSQGMGR